MSVVKDVEIMHQGFIFRFNVKLTITPTPPPPPPEQTIEELQIVNIVTSGVLP
jgi:hypothetical protein